jgi:hypothetical protein
MTHRLVECHVVTGQRLSEWTSFLGWLSTSIPGQQLLRPLRQHPANFPALATDPWNHHAVIPGRLVAQPGDHRRLGPLLDGDALRAGHGAAADRRGMVSDGTGQAVGEIGVTFVKSQERHDRSVEILDVSRLGLVTASGVACLFLGVAFG